MPAPSGDLVERIREHFDEGCFACGSRNPSGLGIDDFSFDGGLTTATFRPDPLHRGLASTLHGGLTATALDEIMVWAGILGEGVLSVTGTMDLKYRRPAPLGSELALRGEVLERRGRRLRLAGSMLAGDDVLAESTGLYLVTETIEELLA